MAEDPSEPLALEAEPAPLPEVVPAARRRRHWEMLVIASLVVVLSFLFRVMPDQEHVAVGGSGHWVLPGTCLSQELFGISCPGCGLTRSFVYLAHGDFRDSLRIHRLGWLLALALLLQFPYRIACLKGHAQSPRARWWAKAFGSMLIFLLIANWLLGFVLHG